MKIKLPQSVQIVLQETESHGKAWKVVLIEEGLSKNGRFYPAEVLKKAVSLFNQAKAFYYEWKEGTFDHLPATIQRMRPEGFPRQIAGWYEDAKFEEIDIEGQKKNALTAILHIHDGAKWLREMLKDAWTSGMRKLVGLSIDADGTTGTKFMDGRPIEVVTSISKVFGIDIVSHPAAGGQFVRLLASYQNGGIMDRLKIIEAIKKLRPELLEGIKIDDLTDEKLQGILETAMKEVEVKEAKCEDCGKDVKPNEEGCCPECGAPMTAEAKKAVEAKKAEAAKKAEDTKKAEEAKKAEDAKKAKEAEEAKKTTEGKIDLIAKKQEETEKKLAVAESAKILESKLSESKLPEPVKKKIAKKFSGRIFEEKELTESLKEEKDVLADLSKDGDVDLGDFANDDIHIGRTGTDRLQASFDLMLDSTIDAKEKEKYEGITPFTSLREAYVRVTGDTNISGVIAPKRLQEGTSSSFTYILGTSMNRRMAKEYKLQPALWKDLADVVSVKDFKTQEVIRWGGFANLEAVSEDTDTGTSDTYPDIAFPGDEEATYSVSSKGGIVKITRKMIINDDLRALVKIPQKIARSAVRTLNQFVFDLLLNYSSTINGGTIYDSLALYHAKHFNTLTAALDYDSFGDAVDQMTEQKEYGFGLATNAEFTAAGTTLSFAASGLGFKVGDYLKCESEFFGPVTVASATAPQVAARGIWGTTDATHASGQTVYVVTDDLMLEPGILWVPTDLRADAESILLAEKKDDTLNNRNPYYKRCDLRVIPRRYLRGDVTNWYITAAKKDIEMIELGFLGGKQEPELLRQDNPGVDLVFTRDRIRFKVRHEYGGAVVDYRGFQGNIVS